MTLRTKNFRCHTHLAAMNPTEMWNARYAAPEFAYGTEPNVFFKTQLDKLPVGKLLLPAEGEGRNAVYAASLGWDVAAFDMSVEGRQKALQLAELQNVNIRYAVNEGAEVPFVGEHFDAVALIFSHCHPAVRGKIHHQLCERMISGSTLIVEAFCAGHLEYVLKNPAVGGPKDLEFLFTQEMLLEDFSAFTILELYETEVQLHEGVYHNGLGKVIRFVGQKR